MALININQSIIYSKKKKKKRSSLLDFVHEITFSALIK